MSKLPIILAYSKAFIGLPYIWGASHPSSGYDCSGLVQELLASVGLDPKDDQTAQTLFNHFELYSADYQSIGSAEAGAILFFGKSQKAITHVSFAFDSMHMLESGGGGSKTITVKDAIQHQAFVRIRPISNRKDLIGIFLPKY